VKRVGIRWRILLAMMAVIGGLLIFTYGVMDALVDRFLDAEIADSLRRGRTAYESFTVARNDVLLDQARSMAQVPHLRAVLGTPDVDEETVRDNVATLGEAVGDSLFFVTNARGVLLADTRKNTARSIDFAANAGVERALLGEEFCGLWSYGDDAYLVALCPVVLDRTVLGLVGIGYPLEKHIRDLREVTGLDVTILRGSDVIATTWVAGTDAAPGTGPETGPEMGRETTLDAAALAAIPSSVEPHDASSRLMVGGRELLVTSIPLKPESTRLLLSRPLDQVLVYFRRAKVELSIIGAAIAVLGLLVSQWIASRIARPIGALTDAANRLARGELGTEVRVASADEIGALGNAFNAMARQLAASMSEIEHKAAAAERANQAKSVFLATMTHELRTPLNCVLGFNAQLLDGDLTPQQREFATTVQRSGEDLLTLIEGVLDFARVDSGRLRVEQREFDLRACLRGAIEAVRPAIEGRGLALACVLDDDLPADVCGPESRLRQILVSYLSNAAKFTPSGRVDLRARVVARTASEATVRVEVRDTGIGIARDALERLFQPFSQIDQGSQREYGGAGLGLALCRELAQLMQGETGVESELGVGSTFWFTAKLQTVGARAVERPNAPEPAAPPAPLGSRASQRLLVVEDNAVNRKLISVVLKKAGWPHSFAENGQQAVDLADAERFELILMDCQMPVMDGFEATRRLRVGNGRTPRDVPVVALTANAFAGDREACMQAGMDGFVAKPFNAPELIALIERCIRSRADGQVAGPDQGRPAVA
jgi:signal transduction histidine kinase/ActR/RegA family two-component response regulator